MTAATPDGSPYSEAVAHLHAALTQALDAGTRDAFTSLLTDDVRWGGEDRGNGHECTTRDEAGDHYMSLLDAGLTLRVADLQPIGTGEGDGPAVLTARMQISSPDPDDFPPEVAIRLSVRGGLISDICILDTPPAVDVTENPVHEAAIVAIRSGDVPALRRLLDEHPGLASARLARHEGRTPLHIATDWPGHHPDVATTIAVLVAAGADPNIGCAGEHPETPLHWAASSDDIAALDALLDAGADINAPGAVIGGGTPMADATAFGQWAAARRLLERGADTNLFEAAALGLVEEVERHLDVNHPTDETITSSLWGACHGGHIGTAAVLLDHGADINWVGYDGLTPLDAARRAKAQPVIDWLELRGATSATSPA